MIRKVYSTLSQELQEHYVGLWQMELKTNLGNSSYYSLGIIMAKAIMDKQFLNIPANN